jgi:hypothetical protein
MSPPRVLKRVLLSLGELAVFALGMILSFLLAFFAGDRADRYLVDYVLVGGIFLTFACVLILRRKTAVWKFAYDVEGWRIKRAERLQNPRRWKCKRHARRVLIWVPSAIAALVLFFFPVSTHVLYPRAGHLANYHISLPWNWVVMPPAGGTEYYRFVNALIYSGGESGFGLVPFWQNEPFVGEASFGIIGSDVEFNSRSRRIEERVSREEAIIRREFEGKTKILCWEFQGSGYNGEEHWSVTCLPPAEQKELAFYAEFEGSKKALTAFYEVIRGVKQAD